MKNNKGFTILEILAAVLVVCLLIVICIYFFAKGSKKEEDLNARIIAAAKEYIRDNGSNITWSKSGTKSYTCLTVDSLVKKGYLTSNEKTKLQDARDKYSVEVVNGTIASYEVVNKSSCLIKVSESIPSANLKVVSINTNQAILKATCTDLSSPIVKIEFTRDGINWHNNSTVDEYTYKNLASKHLYEFKVRCTNELGRSEIAIARATTSEEEKKVIPSTPSNPNNNGQGGADVTKPVCSIDISNPDTYEKNKTLTINGNDAGGLIAQPYSFDGNTYSDSNTKVITNSGTYTAYVKDKVGNVGTCTIEIGGKTEYRSRSTTCKSCSAAGTTWGSWSGYTCVGPGSKPSCPNTGTSQCQLVEITDRGVAIRLGCSSSISSGWAKRTRKGTYKSSCSKCGTSYGSWGNWSEKKPSSGDIESRTMIGKK